MSKSKQPKWFNPTGDDMWDDYYRFAWPVIIVPGLILIVALVTLLAVKL